MGLNIKNEQVHDLVRRLAALTGQSQTSAVEDAVRRRLEEVQNIEHRHHEERLRRLRESIARLQSLPDTGPSYGQIMDEMYDEDDVPR